MSENENTATTAKPTKWTSTAGPIQTKRVNEALTKIPWEGRTFTEKMGVIGVDETSMSFTQICGGCRQDCSEALAAIAERFAWTITRENYQQIIAAVSEALVTLVANRPITDKRRTPEADAAQRAEHKRLDEQREAKGNAQAAAFQAAYCEPERAQVREELMQIQAVLCYDDSDMQTDYSAPHCTLASALLLAVPKQARTEGLARAAVSRYPELAKLDLEWHMENYSGGHGNYLMQKRGSGIELSPELRAAYNRTHAHWEIQFNNWGKSTTPLAFRGYRAAESTSATAAAAASESASVRYNRTHEGVEIAFPAKPALEVIARIKGHGFRWSMRSKVWYKRYSAENWTSAHELLGLAVAPSPVNGAQDPGEIVHKAPGQSNQDAIVAHVAAKYTPDRFDMAAEDRMAEACGVNGEGEL